MIPDDVHDIIDIAKKVEISAHKHGWDEPPVLGYFASSENSPAYVSRPMPINLQALHPHAGVAVEMMAAGFADSPDVDAKAKQLFPPEIRNMLAGVWLKTEAWMSDIPPEKRGGKMIADLPGAVECRQVTLIDCGGRCVFVQRVRGQKPEVTLMGPGIDVSEGLVATGRVIESLRDLLVQLCTIMDESAWARDAVLRVGVE